MKHVMPCCSFLAFCDKKGSSDIWVDVMPIDI